MGDQNKRGYDKFIQLLSKDERSQLLSESPEEIGKKVKNAAIKYEENTLDLKKEAIASVRKFFQSLNSHFQKGKDQLLNVRFEETKTTKVHNSALSPNILHPRFNEDQQGEIEMITTQAYKNMKQYISQNILSNLDQGGNYIIYGPVGIGKSYALAMVVLDLRRGDPICLILYINNASIANYEYLTKEFCYALQFADITDEMCLKFYKKMTSTGKSNDLNELWQDLLSPINPETQRQCLFEFIEIMKIFHRNVLIIYDQAFSTSNNKVLDDFIASLMKGANRGITVLECSSRSPPESMRQQPFRNECIYKVEEKLTEQQAKEILINKLLNLPQWKEIDKQELLEIFEEIIRITNLIPYELAVICKVAKETQTTSIEALNARYMDIRRKEILNIHQAFKRKNFNKDWITYLALKRLQCRISNILDGNYDENVCCLVDKTDSNGSSYYVLDFYHPLYDIVIYETYFTEINMRKDELLSLNSSSRSLQYEPNPGARGSALERHCLDKLCSLRMTHSTVQNEWTFLPYKRDGTPLSSDYFSFQITDFNKFRVSDSRLAQSIIEYIKPYSDAFIDDRHQQRTPNKRKFKGSLFIPDSLYMKCFDAVFVDPHEMIIFLIQITSNINSHKPSDEYFFDALDPERNKDKKQDKKQGEQQGQKQENIEKYNKAFKVFVDNMNLFNRLQFFKFQWIWLGLIDGNYSNKKLDELKKDIDKESWIVLINDEQDALLKDAQKLYGF